MAPPFTEPPGRAGTLAEPANGILDAIGHTPLVRLERLFAGSGLEVYAKLEALNPGGSLKDRPALTMIRSALERGQLREGMTVVESSSGNLAVGLAQACRYFGLHLVCVVDARTVSHNVAILRAYGAEVEVIAEPDPATGEYLPARLRRVGELLAEWPRAVWLNQYANRDNSLSHRQTMGEIVATLDGHVDYLVCATSTCGTLRGCAEYLREIGADTRVVAVDAAGSVIFGRAAATRLIPGHGASVRPELFAPDLADDVVHVDDLDCVVGCRRLVRREALLTGGSSGAVVMGLTRLADRIPAGARCALILPDRGERYLETIYSDAWVLEHFGDVRHLWASD
jgi:N-(2-amino-2-carboxyethyl)-L-glutamate synthase